MELTRLHRCIYARACNMHVCTEERVSHRGSQPNISAINYRYPLLMLTGNGSAHRAPYHVRVFAFVCVCMIKGFARDILIEMHANTSL